MLTREQKIEILKGISTGKRSIKDLTRVITQIEIVKFDREKNCLTSRIINV